MYDYGNELLLGAGGPVNLNHSCVKDMSIRLAARHEFSVQEFQISRQSAYEEVLGYPRYLVV